MKESRSELAIKSAENIEELEELEELVSENIIDENEHIIDLWEPLEFNITEKYEYVPKSIIFNAISSIIYYGIAYPILSILFKIMYDFKIEGRENLETVEGGAVTIANHVLFIDCAMVALASRWRKIHFTTLEGSFKIPFVRTLIKYLGAMPIPSEIKNKENFIKAVDKLLQEEKWVHFYPEASLMPYYTRIRNFKKGAFDFAVRNNVPIIPMVITFREPEGIRKKFKKKKDVTLKILKPIYPEVSNKSNKEKIEDLKKRAYDTMNF